MARAFLLLFFLVVTNTGWADGPYTRSLVRSNIGSSSSAAAAGSTGQIQYNSAGAFAANSAFTYDPSAGMVVNGISTTATTSLTTLYVSRSIALGTVASTLTPSASQFVVSGTTTTFDFINSVGAIGNLPLTSIGGAMMMTRGTTKWGMAINNATGLTFGIPAAASGVTFSSLGGITNVAAVINPNSNAPTAVTYSFAGDVDTGMLSPGANTLALYVSATEALRVVSNTFVGVSTINPSVTLHVSGTSILGRCNAGVTCGANQLSALCYSSTFNSYAMCNGANSWTLLTSSTIISASSL